MALDPEGRIKITGAYEHIGWGYTEYRVRYEKAGTERTKVFQRFDHRDWLFG